MRIREKKGITLIALVITIIILLILAGVTLSLIVGSDGIIKRAVTAVEKTNEQTAKEIGELKVAEIVLSYYEDKYVKEDETLDTPLAYIQDKIKPNTEERDFIINVVETDLTVSDKNGNVLAEGTLDKDGKLVWKDKSEIGGGTETPTPTNPTLISTVTKDDYGKTTNYSTTVTNSSTGEKQVLDNWKVLYNDGKNVYIIYGDYLPNALVPSSTGFVKVEGEPYHIGVSYTTDGPPDLERFINDFLDHNKWTEFSDGFSGAKAIGTPKPELIINSYNQKYEGSDSIQLVDMAKMNIHDTLYFPNPVESGTCAGYWLAQIDTNAAYHIWGYFGMNIQSGNYSFKNSLRPVVILPANATGVVKDGMVEIDIK